MSASIASESGVLKFYLLLKAYLLRNKNPEDQENVQKSDPTSHRIPNNEKLRTRLHNAL